MTPVVVGKTVDCSVLGILVEFARTFPEHMGPVVGEHLPRAEDYLAETPCDVGRESGAVVFPIERTRELLERWRQAGVGRARPRGQFP